MPVLTDPSATAPCDDQQLLAQYAQDRSSAAFGEIVHRYADLVYSSARRQLHDTHEAEDVTQAVFILLTQKAAGIRGPLAGWLLLSTHYCCKNAIRTTQRRTFHEQQAADMKTEILTQSDDTQWNDIKGSVDSALLRLKRGDRDAIALRYLRGMNLRQVGIALGIGEDAARKRVERGMQRLRDLLGSTAAPSVIGEQLLLHGTHSAPAHLITLIGTTGGGAAKGAAAAVIAHKAGTAMAWAQVKIAAAVVAAAIIIPAAPLAVHIAKTLSTPSAPIVQTPVAAPQTPPTPEVVSPDLAPVESTTALTQQQILTALQNNADLNIQSVSSLSGKDLTEAIAEINVDDDKAQTRSYVTGITRLSLEDGGATIMTCANEQTAQQLRDALVAATDEDFAFASGSLVVQVTGTPQVQVAAARAIADDAGLQYLDVVRLTGHPMVRFRWSDARTVGRLESRLHITQGIRKVDVAWYEDNGRQFHVVTINLDLPTEDLSEWSGGSGIKYRFWNQTAFAIKNNAGDPYPGIYGHQPYDEFACRISRLSFFGIKIKSLHYITDAATNDHSDPVIDAVCSVSGKDIPLQFRQTSTSEPPAVSASSMQFDDVVVQSTQGPIPEAIQSVIKSALSLQGDQTP
jgi:RNA polymerase sigma factor (sigma-70 family)